MKDCETSTDAVTVNESLLWDGVARRVVSVGATTSERPFIVSVRDTYGNVNSYYYTGWTAAPCLMQKKEGQLMRGLYEVFIVDPETEDARSHVHVVAADEQRAQLKAVRRAEREGRVTDLDDWDDLVIIVRRIGDVPPKRAMHEVRIAKE